MNVILAECTDVKQCGEGRFLWAQNFKWWNL